MKTFFNSIGKLLIALLFMALISTILFFTLFFLNRSIQFLNLEEGLAKAAWTYFHFIAISLMFWLAKTFTIIYNVNKPAESLKKRKALYYGSGVILALSIAIFFNRINDEITNINFTNAVYYFIVILLPLLIGIFYGFIKLSKMTKEEKWQLKRDIN